MSIIKQAKALAALTKEERFLVFKLAGEFADGTVAPKKGRAKAKGFDRSAAAKKAWAKRKKAKAKAEAAAEASE